MFKKVIRDLTSRKMRTLLVVLSVAIGVFGVSAVGTMAGQLQTAINGQYKASNPPDITINTSPVSAGVIQKISGTPNVKGPIEGRLVTFEQWKPQGKNKSIQIVGYQNFTTHNTIARTTLKSGAFPKPGEAMVENGMLSYYNLKVGGTITILGAHGRTTFKIAGSGTSAIYQPVKATGFGTVFLNMSDASKLAGFNLPNTLYVKLHHNALKQGNATGTVLRSELGSSGVVVNSLTVSDPKNPPGNTTSQLVSSLLGVFAVIALLTSSFLVINTVSTVVAEQRSQIGGMKAVGATTGIITRLYLGLALLYGIIGTIVGLVLGVAGSYVMLQLLSSMVGFDPGAFSVSSGALIIGIIVGLGVPLLAAILPVWLGSRVTIREAIMSYGLGSNFGRGILAKIVLALGFLPVTLVLASRNMIRNRTRVVLTILGLAVAGACIISVLSAQTSLARALDKGIKTYKADIVVSLGVPQPASKVTSVISQVSGVKYSEGWFVTNVQNGQHLTDSLTGLPINTVAYDTSVVVKGRWFRPGDQNVVIITEMMKQARKYKVGQVLAIKVGRSLVHWKVVGVVRDLGAGATGFYAPINQATQAAGAPAGIVQQAMVKLTNSSHANVDKKADAINQTLIRNGISAHDSIVYQFQAQLSSGFNVIFVLLYIVVLIVAVVGALGLFGTITMNVLERQKEIGVLRSVGASTRAVLTVFLAEGVLLGLVGWVLAIVLGAIAASLFGSLISSILIPLTVSITAVSLLVTLIVIVLVAFLAALLPSISAARTQIAQILRYA